MKRILPKRKPPLPKRVLLTALLSCAVLAPCATHAAQSSFNKTRPPDSRIRLNTIGFLPGQRKRASVAARFEMFRVVEAVGVARVVFNGRASGPFHNEDTDEDLYVADFSALKVPGVYRLEVEGGGSSAPLRVASVVYVAPTS